jgi:hypothetical protein
MTSGAAMNLDTALLDVGQMAEVDRLVCCRVCFDA